MIELKFIREQIFKYFDFLKKFQFTNFVLILILFRD